MSLEKIDHQGRFWVVEGIPFLFRQGGVVCSESGNGHFRATNLQTGGNFGKL